MPRIFRHYVPYRLLALPALEACVVFASVFAGLWLSRLVLEPIAPSTRHRRRLLLLGSGRAAEVIAHAVNGSNPNYELLGCVDGQPERIGREVNGVKILGTVQDLPRLSRTVRPDVIVVALAERRHALPLAAILECKLRGIEVQDWPNFYEKLTRKIHLTELRPSWLVFS